MPSQRGQTPLSHITILNTRSIQATLDSAGVTALLPGSQMWYDLCFRPTARLPRPVVYRFDVSGGPEGASLQHDVIVSGDHFTVARPDAHTANLIITCSAETYLLCLYGRVEWVAAQQEGRIIVAPPSDAGRDAEMQETFHHDHLMRFHAWYGGL